MTKNDIKCWVLQDKTSGRFMGDNVCGGGSPDLGKAWVCWTRREAARNKFKGERVVKVIATLRLAKKGE